MRIDPLAHEALMDLMTHSLSFSLTPLIQSITCGGILYGTSLIQAYYYIIDCDQECNWTKCFVVLIFLLETVATALTFWLLNNFTIGWTNPISLLVPGRTLCVTPICVLTLQFLVSSFYIGRMWLYTKNTVLTMLASSFVLARSVGLFYVNYGICKSTTWVEFFYHWNMRIPLIVALSSGPVADGITALTIAVYLYRSSPRMRRMKQIVTWLLVMTVNTGFILFANGLCALITYLTMPDSFAWSGMLLISGKLYANSLFAMLNGRNALRAKLSEPMIVRTTEITMSSVSRDELITQPERVHIYREVYRGVDIDSNGNPVKQDEVGEDISAEQFCAR